MTAPSTGSSRSSGQTATSTDAKAEKTNAEGHDVNAPLSGSVHRLLVSEGDQVLEGDVLLVLEAMKMETEIRSDRAGVVGQIHVDEGDSVSSGDALVTLE